MSYTHMPSCEVDRSSSDIRLSNRLFTLCGQGMSESAGDVPSNSEE